MSFPSSFSSHPSSNNETEITLHSKYTYSLASSSPIFFSLNIFFAHPSARSPVSSVSSRVSHSLVHPLHTILSASPIHSHKNLLLIASPYSLTLFHTFILFFLISPSSSFEISEIIFSASITTLRPNSSIFLSFGSSH
ncbi:hypothetical protein P7C65_05s1g06540 [Encephalitozoon intestinalis]